MSRTVQTDRATDHDASSGTGLRGPAWPIVARREIVAKLTDRAFLIGTLLTVALITGFMVVQGILGERTSTYTVVATQSARAMADAVQAGAPELDKKVRVKVTEVADDAAATTALTEDDADAWLHPSAQGWTLTSRDEVPSKLAGVTETVVRTKALAANAAAAGTTMAQIEQGGRLEQAVLRGDAEKNDFSKGMGFALAFLFYIASLTFGFTLAGSVVEEKASRIVEIITTRIPVRQLLAGKVVGNVILAFAQMAIYVVIGLVGLSFTPYASYLPSVTGALGWFLAFFVVGFILISCLWAVAGALASRSEDLQSTASPLTMLMMAMFFGAMFLKGTVLTVCSFVPPLSAILMPIRVLQGSAAWWEPVVAIALLLAASAVVVLAAERLYRRSLLQTQGRLSLRQAWSSPE